MAIVPNLVFVIILGSGVFLYFFPVQVQPS